MLQEYPVYYETLQKVAFGLHSLPSLHLVLMRKLIEGISIFPAVISIYLNITCPYCENTVRRQRTLGSAG